MNIIKHVAPQEKNAIFLLLVLGAFAMLAISALFTYGILFDYDQKMLGGLLALDFLILSSCLAFFRKFFMPKLVIEKKRRGKLEIGPEHYKEVYGDV